MNENEGSEGPGRAGRRAGDADVRAPARFGPVGDWRLWLVLLVIAWTADQAFHLTGYYWDSDEGINLMKARMLQLGEPMYSAIWSDQPPGLTVILAGAFALLGPSIVVARGIVLLHAGMLLFSTAWLVRSAGGSRVAALASVVVLGVAPDVFWSSRAVMIGLPALAWTVLSLAATLHALSVPRSGRTEHAGRPHARWAAGRERTRRSAWMAAAGLAFGIGLSIKLIGLYVLPAVALAMAVGAWRAPGGPDGPHPWRERIATWARDGILWTTAAAVPLGIAWWSMDGAAMVEQTIGGILGARQAYELDRAWNIEKLGEWLAGGHLYLVGPAVLGWLALLRGILARIVRAVRVRVAPDGAGGTEGPPGARAPEPTPEIGAGWTAPAQVLVVLWAMLALAAVLQQTPLWPKHHFQVVLVALAPLVAAGVDAARRAVAALRGDPSRGVDGIGPPVGNTNRRLAALPAILRLAVAVGAFGLMAWQLPTAVSADLARRTVMPFKASGKLPSHSDSWLRMHDAVRWLRAETPRDATIITDQGVIAFLSGRRVPPELCVISGKRMESGALTADDLIRITVASEPSVVMLYEGGRLSRIPRYADWVRQHAVLVGRIGEDYRMWAPVVPADTPERSAGSGPHVSGRVR